MKKILILTAGFGEGHNTAAKNIRRALEELSPGEVKAEVLDLFNSYGTLNVWAKKTYLGIINHTPALWQKLYELLDSTRLVESILPVLWRMRRRLAAILDEQKPDAVVSTYPLYKFLIDESPAANNGNRIPWITVVTDSITINSVWYRAASDYFVVANDDTAVILNQRRVPPERIRVLGFPVALQFAANGSARKPPMTGARRILYMINAGRAEAPTLVRRLIGIPDVLLTVTVGRDPELHVRIEKIASETGRPIDVYGWTDKLPDLLMNHHLLIGKAGGATVQEAIAAKTPMIVSQVVPGQEEGNVKLLLENECGALAESTEEIANTVERAFANDAQLWRKWVANVEKLSRPAAAIDIARFVLDAADPAAGR